MREAERREGQREEKVRERERAGKSRGTHEVQNVLVRVGSLGKQELEHVWSGLKERVEDSIVTGLREGGERVG